MAQVARDYRLVSSAPQFMSGNQCIKLMVDITEDILVWNLITINPGSVVETDNGHSYDVLGAATEQKKAFVDIVAMAQARHDADLLAVEAERDAFRDLVADLPGNEEARQVLYDHYEATYVQPIRAQVVQPNAAEFQLVVDAADVQDTWDDGQ